MVNGIYWNISAVEFENECVYTFLNKFIKIFGPEPRFKSRNMVTLIFPCILPCALQRNFYEGRHQLQI